MTDMKDLKNNLLFTFVSLAVLVSLGLWYFNRLDESHSSNKAKADLTQNAVKKKPSTIPKTVNTRSPNLAFYVKTEEERKAEQERRKSIMATYQSMINDSMLMNKNALDQTYAALFAQLKLTSEEMDMLKELIVELKYTKENAKIQVLDSGNISNAKNNFENSVSKIKDVIMEDIFNLLGPQRFEEFEHYENTLPQRAEVEKIEHQFSYEADPLTSDQKELLIDIFQEQARLRDEANNSNQKQSSKNSKKQAAYPYKSNILKQAAPYLSESQVKSLQKHLNSMK